MSLDTTAALARLKEFDFSRLFTQDLGWDNPPSDVSVIVAGKQYALRAVAQKRGFVVYHHAAPRGEGIPDSTLGRKIDRELTRQTREHIVVFTDEARTTQVWQWVKREENRTLACRRHTFNVNQPGESFLQKLDRLFVSLDEEEDFTIVEAAGRVRAAFDIERVTRRFYDRFQAEHEAFLTFVKGIREQGDREWYASLMLNRLMFIYFIQKRRFLDGDVDYLRNRLARVKLLRGKDKFHSFYRQFLLRLFHEGLGKPPAEREQDLEELLGEVPYLNGGLFDQHELERVNPDLEIADRAFERVFAFFEEFDWTLEPRPAAFYAANPAAREEINPDILGYIFEKYINQKEMGAYYTKEDITEYIAKNTIIPFLLDAAKKDCAVAFGADRPLWRLLAETPDAYLYPAVRHGVIDDQVSPTLLDGTAITPGVPNVDPALRDGSASPSPSGDGDSPPRSVGATVIPLPDDIAAGLDDVSRRGGWNKPAEPPFALPTETWREHVARRRRCLELRARLSAGEIHEINDLITYNLDIRRFALDAIENCEGPEFLRAFYLALERVSVLDPTCGSGAFLFAALNILEPLYEACLDRMREFVDDADASGKKRRQQAIADFQRILDRVAEHPSREYFIHKSIVVNNLHGVDIMEEAVEICKLRLFLKLVAQVDDVRHLEPLPDIDFNIRSGNTLVGFTSLDEIRKSQEGTLGFAESEIAKLEVQAAGVDKQFKRFRALQTGGDCGTDSAAEIAAAKSALRSIQAELGHQLDEYLAGEYGIDPAGKKQAKRFHEWRASHRPFHWFVDFYGALSGGGFDVVIGNPPYVNASKVRRCYDVRSYSTARCPDIYSWCLERVTELAGTAARVGMIVPLSLTFSEDFASLRSLLLDSYSVNWFSSFGRIPSALFSYDVRVRNTIHLGSRRSPDKTAFSSRLHRWFEEERESLFSLVEYARFCPRLWEAQVPKIGSERLMRAFEAISTRSTNHVAGFIRQRGGQTAQANQMYFKKTAYNWLAFSRQPPPCYAATGEVLQQSQLDSIAFTSDAPFAALQLLLNGKIALSYWFALGDDFHVTKGVIFGIPVPSIAKLTAHSAELEAAAQRLTDTMETNISFKLNAGKRVGNFNLAKCRHATNASDRLLMELFDICDIDEEIELLYAQMVKTDFEEDSGG